MVSSFSGIKSQFPIFSSRPNLIYLDNAATSHKPQSVITAMSDFYANENANIHRGLYELSAKATQRYEGIREKVGSWIGASPRTIAFTKGTTESINIVAQRFLRNLLRAGDNVVISAMEHHANLIPWQQVCLEKNAVVRIIPVDANGELVLDQLDEILNSKTRLVALTHVSNTVGTLNPVEEIVSVAHRKKIPVLLDGAQSVGHQLIDVAALGVDFLAFSAHKMFGPFGVGVLYTREELMPAVGVFNYGGGSIKNVTFEETEFMEYPHRLEAGTVNVAGVIGLGAAVDFIRQFDVHEAFGYVRELATYFKEGLRSIGKISLVGDPKKYGGIVSFQVENIHPHDVATFLSESHIAVRAGHHCTQPLLESMGIPATVRASFSIYNTQEEVDQTLKILREIQKFWT